MRGRIEYRARAAQVRDFSGLRWGNITPTDIDVFIDFGNHVFIIIEAKTDDAELPCGQRLALERLCDACAKSVVCYVLIVSHTTPVTQDIDYSTAILTEYRYHRRWIFPQRKDATCKEVIDFIYNKWFDNGVFFAMSYIG